MLLKIGEYMSYKIAGLTMSYNESVFLDLWQRHYGEALGYDCLFVVDHGSQPPPDLMPMVNRLRVPRTVLDEREKVRFLSDMSKSLLHYFDAVVFSDVDEFIVVDPALGQTLAQYIESSPHNVIHPVGLNVVHNRVIEPTLRLSGYLFDQRRYAQFDSLYCKPSIIKEPVSYRVGMHRSHTKGFFTADIFLFHLRAVDFDLSRARYEKFETLKWTNSDSDLELDYLRNGFQRYADSIFTVNLPDGFVPTDQFDFAWEVAVMNALHLEEGESLPQDLIADGETPAQLPKDTRPCDLIPERFRKTILLG